MTSACHSSSKLETSISPRCGRGGLISSYLHLTTQGEFASYHQEISSQLVLDLDRLWYLKWCSSDPWYTLLPFLSLSLLKTTFVTGHSTGFWEVSFFSELWDFKMCLMPCTMSMSSSCKVRLRREAGLSASVYRAAPMTILASFHLRRYPFRHCLFVLLIDLSSVSVVKWLR